MKKRVLSLLLVSLLLISLLPVTVLAEGESQPENEPAATQEPTGTHLRSETYQMAVPDGEKSSADRFEGFVKRQMGKRAPKEDAKVSSGAGDMFSGQMAVVYASIISGIHQVAIGQRASTEFEIYLSDVGTGEPARMTAAELGMDSIPSFSSARNSFFRMLYIALKADCPYDLYWHKVTRGVEVNGGFSYNAIGTLGDGGAWVEFSGIYFGLCVDKAYRDGDDQFSVNTTIGQTVVTAGNNARAIVKKYASKSDYEKLRGYNKEICDAVEYDYDAVDELGSTGSIDHGDPWQLIWAFDGDPSTNIVCEGYSKAFQHLCDMTSFTSDTIRSIIVSGDAGGGHMWNVVRMEDGKRYLMDVTWSDGSSGNEAFFLIGADGTYPTYSFYGSSRSYSEETKRLYGEEKLTLSSRDYEPGACSIAIMTQPKDVTVVEGAEATFTVEATGDAVTYQWYSRTSAAGSWTAVKGATANTLILVASADMDGWQYRCLLKNADSEIATDTATLYVREHVPGEPVRENVVEATCTTDGSYDEVVYCTDCGMELSRTHVTVPALGHNPGEPVKENEVTATCTTDGSYDEVVYCIRCKAELSRTHVTVPALGHNPGEPVKENVVEATCTTDGGYDEVVYCTRCKAELSRTHKVEVKHHTPGEPVKENEVPATTENVGSYDEVIYCTRCGAELSREHKIIDKLPIHVTFKTQPKSVTVKSGSKATFKVKVKEKHVTYQWYYRAPGAKEWTKIPGATKASYQVAASKANDGWQFRCGVTNETEAFSNPATLTVKTQKPVIKTQPKNLTAKSGKKVKFSVKASGKNITYQWFTRANAESEWQPVAGGNKKDLNVVASKANNGSQYYCYLKNADGDATSAIVTLTVTPEAPTIKTQPKDAKVKIGAKAKFKVKAKGKNVTYQWYYRTSEAGKWVLMKGETSANLTVTATADKIGWQFRCLAKNADGQVYSNPATLRQK